MAYGSKVAPKFTFSFLLKTCVLPVTRTGLHASESAAILYVVEKLKLFKIKMLRVKMLRVKMKIKNNKMRNVMKTGDKE